MKENLFGEKIVLTAWPVSVTALQKQLNMEKQVLENADINVHSNNWRLYRQPLFILHINKDGYQI
jgi:hypothetical protein